MLAMVRKNETRAILNDTKMDRKSKKPLSAGMSVNQLASNPKPIKHNRNRRDHPKEMKAFNRSWFLMIFIVISISEFGELSRVIFQMLKCRLVGICLNLIMSCLCL
jgi:hypothetical protein